MPYVPTRQERLEDAKRYALPAVAVVIVLSVAGWVVWHGWEPRTANGSRRAPTPEISEKQTPAPERVDAEALRAAFENALTLARAAATQERWDDAQKAFAEARGTLAEINARFPGSRAADPGGLGRIDAEIANLRARGLAVAVVARERDGDAAATAGRTHEAAGFFAAAIALQRQVNENFPGSRAASVARADELEVKRDSVLAAALLARATALDREIGPALARRQTAVAGERIAAAVALVDEAKTGFPRSRALDAPLQAKLVFLGARRAELDALQAEVYPKLAPVPGAEKIRMLKTEVPQDIFSRVMGSNPSRNSGRALPVDSVNWLEVQEFCRRLSWLLGLRVRLPTEAEFRAAASAGGEAWSADTSGGHSHEAGEAKASAAGFHDLMGNLAEWLEATDESSATAPVAGGSYLDTAETLAAPPVVSIDKHERARHIGFRVVVEFAP